MGTVGEKCTVFENWEYLRGMLVRWMVAPRPAQSGGQDKEKGEGRKDLFPVTPFLCIADPVTSNTSFCLSNTPFSAFV